MPVRRNGRADRANNTVKEAFTTAFHELGGVEGIVAWAKESSRNRRDFYQWYSRMLPREQVITTDSLENLTLRIQGLKDLESDGK